MSKLMDKILEGLEYMVLQEPEVDIFTGMEHDSRKVAEGNIFVALEGEVVDGHSFIDTAIQKGARLIFVSKEVSCYQGIGYILIKNLRKHLGVLASNFYDWPQRKMKILGVTGTNGKTTTTYLLEQLLGEERVARFGTIEYKIGKEVIEAPNTTPESLDLVRMIKKAYDQGLEYVVMEVSSHALELGRVNMIEFDGAIFTNLTLDHLDYHKTMEQYFMAKRKLFLQLRGKEIKIFNIDDNYGKRLWEEFHGISYGTDKADVQGKILGFEGGREKVELSLFQEKKEYKIQILGGFNLYNLLGSIALVKELGMSNQEIFDKVEKLQGAPGRFETLDCGQEYTVIIDYAHTGDALENILRAIQEIKTKKIITIFGCGGDRDPRKRPIMAGIAEKYSDFVVLTSDNPRTENPESILEEVKSGFTQENHICILERAEAIAEGIRRANKGDIVLIAGKGHETYQILGRKKYHFDDREFARREIVFRKQGR